MKRLEFDGFFAIIGGIAGFMFGSIDDCSSRWLRLLC